jgi:hypothetical protein
MIFLDIPPKVLEALMRIYWALLWKELRDVNGGHYLIVRDKVCSLKCFGGFGVPNLCLLNLAL